MNWARDNSQAQTPEPGNFVCSICLEPLNEEAGIESTHGTLKGSPDKSALVTLHCGHLFHMICLEQTYLARGDVGKNRCCPICKRELRTETAAPMIRLYPTTDDQPKPCTCNECKILEAELEKLKLEFREMRKHAEPKRDWTRVQHAEPKKNWSRSGGLGRGQNHHHHRTTRVTTFSDYFRELNGASEKREREYERRNWGTPDFSHSAQEAEGEEW